MATDKVDYNDALTALCRVGQGRNLKLRDVAEQVVRTREPVWKEHLRGSPLRARQGATITVLKERHDELTRIHRAEGVLLALDSELRSDTAAALLRSIATRLRLAPADLAGWILDHRRLPD